MTKHKKAFAKKSEKVLQIVSLEKHLPVVIDIYRYEVDSEEFFCVVRIKSNEFFYLYGFRTTEEAFTARFD